MMKRRVFAFAAALAMASATSFTAVGAPGTAPAAAPAHITELSPCQVALYQWCMAKFGDHGYCYWEAEVTPC
jgi:hypothetical protein